MRLFLAIELDDAARAAITAEQKRIASAIDREKALTWVAADRAHLTLVFLGEVPDPSVPAIVEAVNRDVGHAPFDVVFAGVGVFPPESARKPPRVLWLGLVDGGDETIAVHRTMSARIAGLGVTIEDRGFHPHLTLARWRRSAWSDRRRVADAASDGPIARIRVDHVTLFQSRLSSSGPSYTPLARANLLRTEAES
jgi:2'-5' RNA ligase